MNVMQIKSDHKTLVLTEWNLCLPLLLLLVADESALRHILSYRDYSLNVLYKFEQCRHLVSTRKVVLCCRSASFLSEAQDYCYNVPFSRR